MPDGLAAKEVKLAKERQANALRDLEDKVPSPRAALLAGAFSGNHVSTSGNQLSFICDFKFLLAEIRFLKKT